MTTFGEDPGSHVWLEPAIGYHAGLLLLELEGCMSYDVRVQASRAVDFGEPAGEMWWSRDMRAMMSSIQEELL